MNHSIFKTARTISVDDYAVPAGEEWPARVYRVNRAGSGYDTETGRQVRTKARLWFSNTKFSDYPLDSLIPVY
ncbi:hypothetical protein [Brevibacterium moorei]|uniref:hypothetical protein n=1 Tax=Brevibacterium moorei TaxID=2968457 RepID=UPI00211CBE77|nr:hypothetical protein [Brevibacterium sp. 68QC2CO]MCQ9384434.1 hypothetical protein [Brevibacterium sp. 68QC2CO]